MSGNFFKKKEVLAGLGFLMFNLAVLGLGGWFLTSKIISQSQALENKKAELEAAQNSWQEAVRQQKEIGETEAGLAQMQQLLVPSGQPLDFINSLENLAQKTNSLFDISLLAPSPSQKTNKETNILRFQIQLGGSFVNFMHFLKYLENMKYLVQEESLNLSRQSGQSQSSQEGWKALPSGSVFGTINIKVFTSTSTSTQ